MPETRTPSRREEPKPEARAPARNAAHDAIMNKVMPLLLVQHNVAALGKARQEGKIAGLQGHVQRGIDNGLTLKMVDENLAAGRPPHFIETGE